MMPFFGCRLLMGLIHCNGHYVLWLIGCFSHFFFLLMTTFVHFSWPPFLLFLGHLISLFFPPQSNGWLFVYSYQRLRVTSH